MARGKYVPYKDRRRVAIEKYGGRCKCCGEDRPEFLAFDHINNDGAQFRKKNRNIVQWLFEQSFPDTIQLLCHNCNFAKPRGCPHKCQTTDSINLATMNSTPLKISSNGRHRI